MAPAADHRLAEDEVAGEQHRNQAQAALDVCTLGDRGHPPTPPPILAASTSGQGAMR